MSNFRDLDQLLQGFVDNGLPGCGLQITQHGKTIYENYFGYADVAKKIPVTKDSLFRLASMSKLVLYTSMMLLYERGKFNLTDPVANWLPEWANVKKYITLPNGEVKAVPTEKPMTISDIMSMKCGLPYCNSYQPTTDPTLASMQRAMQPLLEKGHYNVQEHIAAMSKAVLAYEPGTHWTYGFSSEITAAVLEKLMDMPIDDCERTLLLDPLGMDHTRTRFEGDDAERLVQLYDLEGNELHLFFDEKHLPGEEHEAGWPRFYSNCNDFSKLFAMLSNGGVFEGKRIMGRKTIDLMRANGLTPEMLKDYRTPYEAGYGYGYGVRTLIDKGDGNHNGSIGSFGWTGGFGTWCEADPEDEVGIVYMHNTLPNQELYYHHRVRNVAYGCID